MGETIVRRDSLGSVRQTEKGSRGEGAREEREEREREECVLLVL